MRVTIRSARPSDAEAIAEVRVSSSRTAYAHILPPERLVPLAPRAWAAKVRGLMDDPQVDFLVAEAHKAGIVGFACAGPSRGEGASSDSAELQMLYVTPAHWRKGVGGALLARMHDQMVARGYTKATLWVLRDNGCGRTFYSRCGWWPDGASKDRSYAIEVRYTTHLPQGRL